MVGAAGSGVDLPEFDLAFHFSSCVAFSRAMPSLSLSLVNENVSHVDIYTRESL